MPFPRNFLQTGYIASFCLGRANEGAAAILVGIGLLGALSARADTVTETFFLGGGFEVAPHGATGLVEGIPVSAFDPALGTLTSVTLQDTTSVDFVSASSAFNTAAITVSFGSLSVGGDAICAGTCDTAAVLSATKTSGLSGFIGSAFVRETITPYFSLTNDSSATISLYRSSEKVIYTYTPGPPTPAQATVNTGQPVDFGNVRIGTAITPTALSITNSATPSAVTEKLIGNVAGTTGTGITAAGAINPELAAGQTNSTSITVGIDTSTVGAKSGNAVIDFKSDGSQFGDPITDLGNTNVAVTGNVFRLATGSVATPVNLGATRVGGPALTGAISVTNTAANDGFSENLDATIGGNTGDVIGSGGIVTGLAAQQIQSALSVTLDSSTSGAKSGTATVQFQSDGTGIDGGAPIDNGAQAVTVTGKVYQTAVASVSPNPVSFGIVHVGDAVSPRSINVANTATGALTDVITGNIGSITGGAGAFTGNGTLGAGVVAGTSSNALQVGLDTSHAGFFSGQANFALSSHDDDLSDVALAVGPVSLEAQVNNYANGVFEKTGGDGSLSGLGTSYKLDFGTRSQTLGSLLANIAVMNDVNGPADDLSGTFIDPTLPSNLTLGSFTSFLDLAAGGTDGLFVSLNENTPGFFDVFVTLDLTGSNSSGFSGALPSLTLELTGDIVAPPTTPEPASLAILGTALAGLGLSRRRR